MEESKLYKNIFKCRLCDAKEIIQFVDFGKVALGNNLQISKTKALKAAYFKFFNT